MNKYIPQLSTDAGSCLTVQNWQEVGIDLGSYSLESLLQKPGPADFLRFKSLADYSGWQSGVVLNAASLVIDNIGFCEVKSIYDGSKSRYSVNDLINFIEILKPKMVILPHGFYKCSAYPKLSESIKIFFPSTDYPNLNDSREFGISITNNDSWDISTNRELYIIGENNNCKLSTYLESNQPALDACNGVIYTSNDKYNLLDPSMATQFTLLDDNCACVTCKQGFTKAYFHHLLQHTPLLCQRFLIQHNVYVRLGK